MRVVLISDTHNRNLERLNLPKGDLLIHAGDWTGRGMTHEVAAFNHQLGNIKHKYKQGVVVVAGNHDWLAERSPSLCKEMLSNCTLLTDEELIVGGFKIYGSPHSPVFCNWAFNLPKNGSLLKYYWDQIPKDTDILVTHCPPYGILDCVEDKIPLGCELLRHKVEELNVPLHVFGHIHWSVGVTQIAELNTTFTNASICDEDYQPINKPIVLDINTDKIISFVEEL